MTKLILCSAGFLVALLAVQASAAESKKSGDASESAVNKGYTNINVEQFDKLRANTNIIVLDVRTPEEYSAGHIRGAKNIDVNSPDFEKQVGQLDKSKSYLVHCAAGSRSARACGKLSKLNFTNCYNLLGGMRAWEKAGKPVEK